MPQEIMTLLGTILLVALVLLLAYCFTRFVVGRMSGGGVTGGSGQRIRVLEKVPVGKDERLVLVKLGDTYQFLGVTSGSITCLKQVSAEEAEAWEQAESQKPQTMGFQEALRRVLEQRKSKGGR